jgi:uncharacterized membrane protein/ribosomal protein L37AE/L43A
MTWQDIVPRLLIGVLILVFVVVYYLIIFYPVTLAKQRRIDSIGAVKGLCVLAIFMPLIWIIAILIAAMAKANQLSPEAAKATARRPKGYVGGKNLAFKDTGSAAEKLGAMFASSSPAPSPPAKPRAKGLKCENCGRLIGKLETPAVWRDHIVCTGCRETLAQGAANPCQHLLRHE